MYVYYDTDRQISNFKMTAAMPLHVFICCIFTVKYEAIYNLINQERRDR